MLFKDELINIWQTYNLISFSFINVDKIILMKNIEFNLWHFVIIGHMWGKWIRVNISIGAYVERGTLKNNEMHQGRFLQGYIKLNYVIIYIKFI